ncbi:MAG: TauD/TfdA family dioxygenase, partial [Gemmatimonadaceae bacterium]|nr:TauD/TfdA family dioxygenase [Gemmatimonadaceae bacterium]
MRLDRLSEHIGAEVSGVDIASPIDGGTLSLLRDAFHRHSVLVFRGQQISDEQQVAFSEGFGPLEMTIPSDPIGDGGPVGVISNVDDRGKLIPLDDRRMLYQKGNGLW